jgi:hypothetical protein
VVRVDVRDTQARPARAFFPSRTLHGVLSFAGTPKREEPPRVSIAFNTGETNARR